MKILYLLGSNKFSGAENVVCTIIDVLGDKIDALYCSPNGPIQDSLKERNINYYGLEKLSVRELRKVIKDFAPDIIHANDYRASVIAALSGFKGEIISHLHNNDPLAKTWNLKSIPYSITTFRYNKIIGVSNKVLEEAIFKKQIENKYTTMYNFTNKDMILKKAELKASNKKYDLLFIGRLTEQKDPERFIELVEDIKKKKKDIQAVMIGIGELEEKCQDLINKKDLKNNITMLGFLENPFSIMKNCKACFMPSKWEGFGLTAIETMVLGIPVFCSGVGGLGEIFKNNKEFICKTNEDYVNKYFEFESKNLSKKVAEISDTYCNKQAYLKQLTDLYGLEVK